jgi:hypothetical protein
MHIIIPMTRTRVAGIHDGSEDDGRT